MKRIKKRLSFILALAMLIACLIPAGASALTEAEMETAFSSAVMELENYLRHPGEAGRSLDACIAAFDGLGKYNKSDSFKRYATALQMIERGEFGWLLEGNLEAVIRNQAFAEFVKDMDSDVIRPPEELGVYMKARKAEAEGDMNGAAASYRECPDFYDSTDRYLDLTREIYASVYEKGVSLLEAEDLAGAYYAFLDCPGYELADTFIAMIENRLGYVPSSPTDNPCKHEWQEASCEKPETCKLCGETEGEPLGHKWKEATCTTAKTCTVCGKTEGSALGHDWQAATYDAPETCSRCGETRGTPLPRISVGDVITFGSYEQDNNKNNGKEAVEWLVLEMQGNKALLLSKYGLAAKPYNTSKRDITWEKCTLRSWLNGEFYNSAFSAAEQARIQLTSVDNSKSQGYGGFVANGGNDTQDRVFLLSYAEANKYLGVTYDNSSNTASRVSPTAYAKANGAWTSGSNKTAEGAYAGWWWLRSPGYYQCSASFVSYVGSLDSYYVSHVFECVRPALWVEIS